MTISINAPGSLSDYDYSTAESRGDHSDLPADLINRSTIRLDRARASPHWNR